MLLSGGGGQSGTRAAQDWAAAVDEAGAAQELWRIPQGITPDVRAAGDHWVTDTHLVRRLPGRVVAYNLATGEVAWELPLPGDPADDCPSSQQQSGNRVALLRAAEGERNNCGTVTVLDIATGREVFTTAIPPIERTEVTTADAPVVIGGYVLVGSRAGGHLLNIDTGKHIAVAEEGRCREDAYAVVDGRAMHLVAATDGSVVTYQSANANDVPGLLLSVDAATGAVSPLLPIAAESHEDEELLRHLGSGIFGGDNQQAVWADGRFVIFRMVHRAENVGEVETVAFGRS